MRTTYLAGIGLGLVAAVVFISATTGPFLARLLLMFLTPLPFALAGLGWGWRSALLAGAVGTAFILALSSPPVAAAFALTQAAPMVVHTYLALLSRPLTESSASDSADPTALEWYPAGRLVICASVLAGLMTVAMLLLIGGDLEALRKSLADFLRTALESGLPQVEGQTKLSEAEVAALADIAFGILPAASSMSWISSLLFNLWVAGRVTLASGQLGRPWPDLSAITYPTGTPLAFGLMLAATMLGGYAGLAASAFAGALFIAYVLLGLAIVHFTTRGRPWRPLALWMLYGSLFIVNIWIGIVIAMVGLAETVLHLRARAAQRTPPPTHPNS